MIKYIGSFNEIEKSYIEKQLTINSIVVRQNPYCPGSSIDEISEYIDFKLNNDDFIVYSFKQKRLYPIVTPATFISKLLDNNINALNFLTPKDCIVYIQQGCSEDCICTSACKIKFSVPFEDIKKQILDLPQQEYISLYGINVGDYNYNGMDIIELCKALLKEFPNSKLILCNISPYSPILKDLVNYVKEESRIVPMLYMCINSGSPKILNIEGHKNIDNDLNLLLKNTNIRLIPYLIVGSPEETEQDFKLTIEWVKTHKDILLGVAVLPYTRNGVGNCNQTITPDDLIRRLIVLKNIILEYSISKNNTNLSKELLKNLVEISVCGEDHTFYRRYGFDCL